MNGKKFSDLAGLIDAERCFRIDYQYYRSLASSIVRSSKWFMVYREGFEGISDSLKSMNSSHYKRGLEARKVIFGER